MPKLGYCTGMYGISRTNGFIYSELTYKLYQRTIVCYIQGPKAGKNDTYLPDAPWWTGEYSIGYAFDVKKTHSKPKLGFRTCFSTTNFDFNPVNDAEARKFFEWRGI